MQPSMESEMVGSPPGSCQPPQPFETLYERTELTARPCLVHAVQVPLTQRWHHGDLVRTAQRNTCR